MPDEPTHRRPAVVAVDGPAGTGKSSVSRRLAGRLGFDFLDTGAMYRAVASVCLRRGLDPDAEADAAEAAGVMTYDAAAGRFEPDPGDLRTPEVTRAASLVARHPPVRDRLVQWQRAFAAGRRIVTEGRDQGTVVFPAADVKFFLDASAEERAARRLREIRGLGRDADYDEVLSQIRERDRRDADRPVAPLRAAEDAVRVDTTSLTVDAVVDTLEAAVRERLAGSNP